MSIYDHDTRAGEMAARVAAASRGVKPISPHVASAPPPDIDPMIERVNATLSKPWTDHERISGRTIAANLLGDMATREAVIAVFKREGWVVSYHSDQRDGDYISFTPLTVR
jgi:hypothetical protein